MHVILWKNFPPSMDWYLGKNNQERSCIFNAISLGPKNIIGQYALTGIWFVKFEILVGKLWSDRYSYKCLLELIHFLNVKEILFGLTFMMLNWKPFSKKCTDILNDPHLFDIFQQIFRFRYSTVIFSYHYAIK